jgi:hypothetical protein
MMQSRLTKARRGEAVSNLPIGWIQNPDSSYDFDPEAEATIRLVIETFWQTRSAHATVRALAKAGIQIPYRDRQRICFRKPSVCRVLRILKNLNYSGTYFYGKTQSHPGGPTLPNGQSQRIKVPEEKWIKIFDHHPAYMTKEQQEEIKSILNKNQYLNRDRPGKGPAPMQGLLRCGRCGANLSVTYPTKHSHYHCSRGHGYGEKPCTTFMSDEFDRFILRQVFKTLKTPPVEMLKSALEASRKKKLTRLSWIESERNGLGTNNGKRRIAQTLLAAVFLAFTSMHWQNLKRFVRNKNGSNRRSPWSRLRQQMNRSRNWMSFVVLPAISRNYGIIQR